MGKKRNVKKVIWIIVSILLVLAIGIGCLFYFAERNTEPVAVFPFYYFGMTEYWGDAQESYGPVSTDRIQTVFLSGTQTVTEIFVNVGDTVQKGDLLMTFDTTLSEIALERERLAVEKLKLDLQDAQQYLREINAMRPMVPPAPPAEEPEVDLGMALTEAYLLSQQTAFDGSTQELAMICWLHSSTQIDDELLAALRLQSEAFRAENVPEEPAEPEAQEEETDPSEPSEPENPSEPEEPATDPNVFYVVFKVTDGNFALAPATTWQGLSVTYDPDADSYRFGFYDATGFDDHTIADEDQPAEEPEFDFGSGFTAAQIAQMRSEQEKRIRDLQFQVQMAEAEYNIKLLEASDGHVYAQIDGTVVSLLSPEEAQWSGQPLMKVSGGGRFYITGSIGELDKDTLSVGQEVTVNDWNTGMTYVGTVSSIEDYPVVSDFYSGMGNPNVSYYPFTVYVEGSADLQEGSYVSIQYSASNLQTGVYLENPFLRTENGQSYVYVRGEDGTLEKRTVTTGKSLWGNYTQILEGLSAEDFIAFPYGKDIREGAPTAEGTWEDLMGY